MADSVDDEGSTSSSSSAAAALFAEFTFNIYANHFQFEYGICGSSSYDLREIEMIVFSMLSLYHSIV